MRDEMVLRSVLIHLSEKGRLKLIEDVIIHFGNAVQTYNVKDFIIIKERIPFGATMMRGLKTSFTAKGAQISVSEEL